MACAKEFCTLIMLYKTLARSHLEYANCLWRQIDVGKVEKVQMRATSTV